MLTDCFNIPVHVPRERLQPQPAEQRRDVLAELRAEPQRFALIEERGREHVRLFGGALKVERLGSLDEVALCVTVARPAAELGTWL